MSVADIESGRREISFSSHLKKTILAVLSTSSGRGVQTWGREEEMAARQATRGLVMPRIGGLEILPIGVRRCFRLPSDLSLQLAESRGQWVRE